MNRKLNIFISILCFCIWHTSMAQLHDVYSNKSIEVEHRVIEISPTISFVKSELDFDCLYIINEPTTKTDLANKNILDLFKSYLLNEEKFRPVYQKMLKRVDNFNKIENKTNEDDYRDNSSDKAKASLNEVNCRELGYVSNLLFFAVNFNFWISVGYQEGIEFTVSEYYYADLKNGNITGLNFEWTASQKELMLAKMKDILNNDYQWALTSYNFDNMNELQSVRKIETNDSLFSNNVTLDPSKIKKDMSSKINMDDAELFWIGWGLMINFPKYSESSIPYGGNAFEVFIPMEKAKLIVKDLPEFSFVKDLKESTTSLNDFDLQKITNEAMDIYGPREISDFIQSNTFEEKAKSVRVDYFQLLRDTIKTNLSTWQFDFTPSGDLLKRTQWNDKGKVASTTEYLYSKKGKLLVKSVFSDEEEYENCEINFYSQDGNLIQTIYKNDGESHIYRYFYNGNTIYRMNRYFIKGGNYDQLSKSYYDGKELKLDDQTFLLNEGGKIIGNKTNKYTMYQLQLSRNAKNQLIEVHRENDRYNRYYQYDSRGRLELITNFESARLGKSEQYFYDGIFPFPKRLETFDPSGGHNTHLVFEYTWELY